MGISVENILHLPILQFVYHLLDFDMFLCLANLRRNQRTKIVMDFY